jgi:hypothetical protein
MSKRDYLPKTQADYLAWHDNFKTNVTATTPGATAADVTTLTTDNAALHGKFTAAATVDNAAKAAHADLNNAIATSQANARALAQRIKASTGYTMTLGDQLGIEGAEDSTDLTQQKPALNANPKSGGAVEVAIHKNGAEGFTSTRSATATRASRCSPAKRIRPMWTTGHCWSRANRKRANTKPCSSSANPKSDCQAMSSSRRPNRENKKQNRIIL